MKDLSGYTEAQLHESIRLLRNDPQWAHLAQQCEMEIISRKMPPIEEIFPNGGYVKENQNGELEVVPCKPDPRQAFDEGHTAYWAGVKYDDNPYKEGTYDREQWFYGYGEAMSVNFYD